MERLGCCQRDRARLVEAFDGLLDVLAELEAELAAEKTKVERLMVAMDAIEAQLRFGRAATHGRS